MNGSTHTASTPRLASSSARRRAEQRNGGWLPGLITSSGMRVEGHRHHRQAELPAEQRRPIDDALMTPVHAVELADRDDGLAPSCGHLIEALPAIHDSSALLLARHKPSDPG